MFNRLAGYISPQADFEALSRREAIRPFAIKLTFIAIILAVLLSLVFVPIVDSFGGLPMSVGEAIRYNIVMCWLIGSVVAGVLASIVGRFIHQLSLSRAEFERLSRTDTLSGLLNRRAFSDVLEKTDGDASLVILDLDRFKSINDCYGHSAGDAVIRNVAGVITQVFGDKHLVARLGGEEFAVIIGGGTLQERIALVEQAKRMVANARVHFDGYEIGTTISAGIADFQPGRRKETVYSAADKALYLAKSSGRNRLLHESEVELETERYGCRDEVAMAGLPGDAAAPPADIPAFEERRLNAG